MEIRHKLRVVVLKSAEKVSVFESVPLFPKSDDLSLQTYFAIEVRFLSPYSIFCVYFCLLSIGQKFCRRPRRLEKNELVPKVLLVPSQRKLIRQVNICSV